MTLYELTKKYGEGKGEQTMWSTMAIVSDTIEAVMTEPEKEALIRKVYGVMSGRHYNEDFAHQDIAKMYYVGKNREKHYGPYWSDQDLRSLYEMHRAEIPAYNCWDWAVTMSMIKSDYCPLLSEWFPGDDEEMRNERIVRLAVNWLQDADNPFGDTKIWSYLNSEN